MRTKPRNSTSKAGFTLIEVMVVIAILAAVMAVGAPRLFQTSTSMRTAVRKFAVMTREVRNVARLYNSTMRIVISMNDDKGHSYWIESASGNVQLLSADQQKELDEMTSLAREDEKPKNEFSQDSRVLKSPEKLPRGFFIESIEIAGREQNTKNGTAYVHFFPQGLAEQAVIHFTDRKTLNWTIVINPLTGRADVYERKLSLKDLKQ